MSTYRSPLDLARLASISISAVIFIIILQVSWTLVAGLAATGLMPSPPSGWTDIEKGEQALLVLYVVALLYGATTFIRWQRLLIRNLQALGTEAPDISWATSSWFIPILNLIAPFQVFQSIAAGTAADGPDARPLVSAWWLSWILAAACGGFANVVIMTSTTMDTWFAGAAIDFAASSLRIMTGILALLLLHRLSRQQDSIVRAQAKAIAREATP